MSPFMAVVQTVIHNGSALGILIDDGPSIAMISGVPNTQIVKRPIT
jgi:hypothetical protein